MGLLFSANVLICEGLVCCVFCTLLGAHEKYGCVSLEYFVDFVV